MTTVATPWLRSTELEVEFVPVSQAQVRDAAGSSDVLSRVEHRRLRGLRRAGDRAAYLVAHVRLRQALAQRLGTPPAAIAFDREACPRCGRPDGRPRTAPFRGVHFSVSHTQGLVGIAISGRPIGIDVEVVPKAVPMSCARSLHPLEFAEILQASAGPAAFARCWTRKEALLKASGTGIGHGTEDPYVGAGAAPASAPGWQLLDLASPTGHLAAMAVATPTSWPEVMGGAPGRPCKRAVPTPVAIVPVPR